MVVLLQTKITSEERYEYVGLCAFFLYEFEKVEPHKICNEISRYSCLLSYRHFVNCDRNK